MGCDIHLHREVRRNGKWECIEPANEEPPFDDEQCVPNFDAPHYSRDYWLFGLLSRGVRTEWPFSFAERGLPNDVSPELKHDSDKWDSDGHSHSWLGLEELKTKAAELLLISHPKAITLSASVRHLVGFLEWPEGTADEDCRIVFWFDN